MLGSSPDRLPLRLTSADESDYDVVMPTDLLVLAGNVAEALERHGFVACGRRRDGITAVEFWTKGGEDHRYELHDAGAAVEEIVAACLAMIDSESPAPKESRSTILN